MKKKKPKTYKTDHPTIKEISMRDQFVLENGEIVTFVNYHKHNKQFPFLMEIKSDKSIEHRTYNINLKFSFVEFHRYNIKQRYIPLKDKLDLL